MNRTFIQNNLIDQNDVPAIAAIDCADVKAVLAANYEASAKSDYSDSIGASISTVTSMSHTLTTGCNSFENKYCDAIANALVMPNRLQCIWLKGYILK
jgi:hypothetical protein